MTESANEPLKEQLSAFLDNELPKQELELLLKRLGTDQELRGTLERYVLIGESLRAAPGRQVSRDFAARVSAAVDQESAERKTPEKKTSERTSEPLPVRKTRWTKPLTGFAVAAGAAAGAVLMVRLAPLDPLEVERNARVALPQAAFETAGEEERRWRRVSAGSATQLTHYVVAHSEYSSPIERRNVLTGVLGEAQPVNVMVEIEPELER